MDSFLKFSGNFQSSHPEDNAYAMNSFDEDSATIEISEESLSNITFPNVVRKHHFQGDKTDLSQFSSTSLKTHNNLISREVSKFQKNGINISAPSVDLDVQDGYVAEEKKKYLQRIFPCLKPYNRELFSKAKRESTFNDEWALDTSMNINEMAEAGFYYFDSSQVQCWYCGVVIGGWKKNLSPWKEHARMKPSCSYLLRNRGISFVEEILSKENDMQQIPEPANQSQNRTNTLDSTGNVESSPKWIITVSQSSPPHENQKRCILDAFMSSEIVQKALKKFSQCHICEVLKQALCDALQGNSTDFNCSYASVEQPVVIPGARETTLQPASGSATSQPTSDSAASLPEPSKVPPRTRHTIQAAKKEKEGHKALQQIRLAKKCVICLNQEAFVLFQPCSHICACLSCTQSLKTCPECGKKIHSASKISRQ